MSHCFFITSYCDTQQKVKILNECIDNLKSISSNEICVHAHYPLNEETQKMVNYYLYDYSNPVLKYPEKYITWWRQIYNFTLHIYKDDVGYTVLQQWKRGFDFLKNLHNNIIILNYDVIITKKLLNQIESKSYFDGCNFLHENGNTITPLISINTKTNIFDKISIEKYKYVNSFAEDFAAYIFRDSNCYRFKFDEYKNDFYTTFNLEHIRKDNQLTQHYSPYDIMNFNDFDIFLGEKDNILNILFYNLRIDLNVQIFYNEDKMYDDKIVPYFYLIDTKIQFNKLNTKELHVIVNNNELKIDREIINCCKII